MNIIKNVIQPLSFAVHNLTMEFKFDKEIDCNSAKVGGRKTASAVQSAQAHLDADELSAFAENALPEKANKTICFTLADCDNCRQNLSILILLNSETESEIVRADEKTLIAAPIPWYREFSLFPNLVYSLGALVLLVFGGLIVLRFCKPRHSSENSRVSQT